MQHPSLRLCTYTVTRVCHVSNYLISSIDFLPAYLHTWYIFRTYANWQNNTNVSFQLALRLFFFFIHTCDTQLHRLFSCMSFSHSQPLQTICLKFPIFYIYIYIYFYSNNNLLSLSIDWFNTLVNEKNCYKTK